MSKVLHSLGITKSDFSNVPIRVVSSGKHLGYVDEVNGKYVLRVGGEPPTQPIKRTLNVR